MALLKEMKFLLEEEKLIRQTIDNFKDQLNRLKVEELCLQSELRSKGENSSQAYNYSVESRSTASFQNAPSSQDTVETSVQEELDLSVNRTLQVLSRGGLGFLDQREEEEEDEEEEEEEEYIEEDEINLEDLDENDYEEENGV